MKRALGVVLVLVLAACTTKKQREEQEKKQERAQQAKGNLLETASNTNAVVRNAAARISAQTAEPDTRKFLILWQLRVQEVTRLALAQPDVRWAYLDLQTPGVEKKMRWRMGLQPWKINSFLWQETATGLKLYGTPTDLIDFEAAWIRSVDKLAHDEAERNLEDVIATLTELGAHRSPSRQDQAFPRNRDLDLLRRHTGEGCDHPDRLIGLDHVDSGSPGGLAEGRLAACAGCGLQQTALDAICLTQEILGFPPHP